jgi:hypothetical protein
MNKIKRITFILLIAAIYVAGLYMKDQNNQSLALKERPTMPKIRQENGIPVYAKKISKKAFVKSATVSGFLKKDGVLKTFVTPQEKKLLKVGMIGSFTFREKKYTGRVKSISLKSSVLSGLHQVQLKFQNIPTDSIDQLVIASVVYKKIPHKIVLARETVSLRSGKPFIFEVDDELKLKKQEIKIEQENDEYFVISHGVQVGDTIVISDPRDLRENDKVFISKEIN